jgi:hypothetical protein
MDRPSGIRSFAQNSEGLWAVVDISVDAVLHPDMNC